MDNIFVVFQRTIETLTSKKSNFQSSKHIFSIHYFEVYNLVKQGPYQNLMIYQ